MESFKRLWVLIGKVAVLSLAITVSACAIPTRQTDAVLAQAREVPEASEIRGVPFVLQEENHCGPASLAMVMARAGKPVPVETLAAQVYTPGKRGSLQADLIGAARRHGMLAVEVKGVSSLLREIAAGNAVLTLENQGLSWFPKWHYAVVFGYDLAGPEIILHSGSDQATRRSLRKFERSWKDSDYWGLVVLKPGALAATADESSHSLAAAALEQLGDAAAAAKAYDAILRKWPGSLGALIGMGNLRFAANKPKESAEFLKRAVQTHPMSSAAWHNLAVAQGAAGEAGLARRSAERAMSLATESEIKSFGESLRTWLPNRPWTLSRDIE